VFYGFGDGTDLLFSKHVPLRVQADLVYDHLFSPWGWPHRPGESGLTSPPHRL
jgi:hypothetical protein